MMAYSITTIRPTGFPHASAFRHVQESLTWALAALGHEATIAADNWFSTDQSTTNIIFGGELLMPGAILPHNCIIYNLEMTSGYQGISKLVDIAKRSNLTIWDYSNAGVEYWRKWGIPTKHVPVGYTPNLTRIPDLTMTTGVEKYDMLFYGWLTPRRKAILDALTGKGLTVCTIEGQGVYGGGLDNYIARSRIVLNVHHDGRDQFEIVRVSYLLANGKCVVSETSSDDQDYKDLDGSLCRTEYGKLAEVCQWALRNIIPPESVKRPFRCRDYVETVRKALNDPLRVYADAPIEREAVI
jgi:hypothetical protein